MPRQPNTKRKPRALKNTRGTSKDGSSSVKRSKERTLQSTSLENSRKSKMKPEYYEAIVERLSKDGLTVDRSEHPGITEFGEGPIPLFKLIYGVQDDQTAVLLVSFHIQLDIPTAIQWFANLRKMDPLALVTASYIKDADGVSYVGEDADAMLTHMQEQDMLAALANADRDAEDVLNERTKLPPPSPAKSYSDYRKALIAFQKMTKKKGDVSH